MKKLIYLVPAIIWAGIILSLSLMPGKDLPTPKLWQSDKIGHFLVYAILVIITLIGIKKGQFVESILPVHLVVVALIAFCYGLIIEWMQHVFAKDRFFDIFDILANGAGSAIGTIFSNRLLKPNR